MNYTILLMDNNKYVNVKTFSTFSLTDEKSGLDFSKMVFGLRQVCGLQLIENKNGEFSLKYRNRFLNYDTLDDTFFYSYEKEDLGNRVYGAFSFDFVVDYLREEFGVLVSSL